MKSSIDGGRRLLMVVMSERSALGRCVMSLTKALTALSEASRYSACPSGSGRRGGHRGRV